MTAIPSNRKIRKEQIKGVVQTVTGTAVDNTDPENPVINDIGGSVGAGAGLSIDGSGNIQLGQGGDGDDSFINLSDFTDSVLYFTNADEVTVFSIGEESCSIIPVNPTGDNKAFITAASDTDGGRSTLGVFGNIGTERMEIRLEGRDSSSPLMTVIDSINEKGLEEAADYSANKTDFSYITPAWLKFQAGFDEDVPQVFSHDGAGNFEWGTVSGGGSSNWTVLGSDIYRNSRVLIGASSFTPSDTIAKLEVRGRLSVISGSNDIFIGRLAGPDSPPASNNSIAIGTLALRSLVNGNSNIGIGVTAGQNITSGGSNVGVGDSALSMVSVNSFNVGVGVISLTSTTGSNNTAIGHNSGGSLTSGSNNIFIGYNAGANLNGGSSNISAISQSIYIGSSTTSKAAAQVNEIVIGYDTDGEGSNTVVLGNTSVVKTFLRGTVNMANLPTSSAGLVTGDVWNDSGTLKIV